MHSIISRRTALSVLSAGSLATAMPAAASTDSHLCALGRDFDAVTSQLDGAIAAGLDVDVGLLEQLGRLISELAITQASTMEGLAVKARAACWALLGDVDDPGDGTTDQRMALSIVRDLIRLRAPHLERPGALQNLVNNIERGATSA